jgi:exopolysaccharide biosynthesis polyprenyl glycosylphosphotransferase
VVEIQSVQRTSARGPSDGASTRRPWLPGYVRALRTADALAITVAVVAAYLVRFGADDPAVDGSFSPTYLAVSAVLVVVWLVSLASAHVWDRRVLTLGSGEYTAVFTATWRLFAVVAIVAYLAKMDVGRAFLAIAFPLGLTLLLLERAVSRRWLKSRRNHGECRTPVLVVGQREHAAGLIREVAADESRSLGVVGVCVPGGRAGAGQELLGVPVVGNLASAAQSATAVGAQAVAVTGSDELTAAVVRQLGWDLEQSDTDLLVAGALTDIAGPRIHVTPVAGLPLMQVDPPRFTGPRYVVKSVADWCGALVLTVVLAPVLALIAVTVAATSRGPVLYSQVRIGRDGTTFRMLKFRTMVADADAHVDEVMAGGRSGLFYKRRDDPRVTSIGRFLRRYSLDELPQLLNVLRGDMSLVGPRPQVASEVALYDRAAHRRLLVKPGLTGLWQVSGRSELSPDESIRKDVYYVENWTLFGDLVIVLRTARAVLAGQGAY